MDSIASKAARLDTGKAHRKLEPPQSVRELFEIRIWVIRVRGNWVRFFESRRFRQFLNEPNPFSPYPLRSVNFRTKPTARANLKVILGRVKQLQSKHG